MLGRTHRRHHTPHVAIALTGVAMLVLTLSGSFMAAVAISTLTRLLTYAATCAAVPVLRRRPDAPPALFRAPGGMLTVAVALVVIAWLFASVGVRELRDVGIAMALGLVLLALGRLGARRTA